MMDKKADIGGETVIWIYRFVLLALVIVAYVMIVFNFYSVKYDVRQSEAVLIGGRVIDCVSEGGVIKQADFTENIMKECINFDEKEPEIYVNAILKDWDGKEIKNLAVGKRILKELCGYDVSCSNQGYYLLDGNGKKTQMNVLVAIDKMEKNV